MRQLLMKLSLLATTRRRVKSDDDIAEAIDIYKALGDEPFYGPEEWPDADPQKDQM